MAQSTKRTRSRFGCHRCKGLKVKCDELKPSCSLCQKADVPCDYSIKLTWGGRPFKKQKSDNLSIGTISSFQKKYNSENIDLQDNAISTAKTPVPTPPTLEIKLHDPSTIGKKKKQTRAKIPLKVTTKVTQTVVPLEDDSHIPSLDDSAPFKVQKMTTYNPKNFHNNDSDLIKAFEEIQTPNLSLKSFVNDIILPDLSSSFHDIHQENSNKSNHNYHNSGLSITQMFDGIHDNMPEDLVFSENFITNNISHSDNSGFSFEIIPPITTGFEYISPSPSPLPDLLLQNDLYREQYHSYVEVFSKILCPAPPQMYRENPFTCLLPKMSLSAKTDGLLSILIASSMTQSFRLSDQPFPHEMIASLTSRALKDLYNRLIDPQEADSDYTLALVLLLSAFELICTGRRTLSGWKAHYYGAKKIMFSRGYLKAKALSKVHDDSIQKQEKAPNSSIRIVELHTGQESDLSFFFTRWFAYLDVMGALSASNKFIHNDVNKRFSYNEVIIWKGPTASKEDRENLKDIDPLMGFDLKLLEFFSEIVNISKECALKGDPLNTNSNDYNALNPSLHVSMVQRVLELKERFLSYLTKTEQERDEVLSKISNDPKFKQAISDYEILRATNKVFAYAGILQLYRRVLKLPKDSSLVVSMINSVTEIIKYRIPENTTAAYCTTFSLLSAGADTTNEEDRLFYLSRFASLFNTGMNSARVAKDIMVECWTGNKYWADLLADKNIDIVFV